ncbi:GNAT family N-acetyltransferase [Salipiger sp. 1_MG-2023]|uniref:GNAT family N-acetyltransferase n=1 Tax=Salipiger sp. 1_MG-2023 TaxID=3062665 RepID=UPI0026E31538|nr:GNAT family N-acetyltransferase [Salipiger sp. 1_MG-2023]MDO6586043.1 GNAT family N-acetyltransferase [Salipiger sp. 1_MG-2023]
MKTDTQTTILRPLLTDDAEIVADIFRDSVLNGTAPHYSEAERIAWAGPKPDPDRWRDRIGGSVGLMAEVDGGAVGFMTLQAPGHIDLAFTRPAFAGRGIGAELLNALTGIARAGGARALTSNVSRAARPFFERHGFEITAQGSIVRRGVTLANFDMRKVL